MALARALWRDGRWPETTRALGDVATTYPQEEAGIVAAMLYLEGLNLLGSRLDPPRPSCYEELARNVPILQRLYCDQAVGARHRTECHLLYRLERHLEREVGCKMHEATSRLRSVRASFELELADDAVVARPRWVR